MKEITILAFNLGNAGRHPNGPGICLFNFVNFMRKEMPEVKINVFTKLPSSFGETNPLERKRLVYSAIDRSEIVHHWSGLGSPFDTFIKYANVKEKVVLVGPNVIDGVEFAREVDFLRDIEYNKLLVVNDRLKFLIHKEHKIKLDKISTFMVGPDLSLWTPSRKKNNKILWKGNSSQYVKDIDFAIDVMNRLPQYQFILMGYPKPYDYWEHVNKAKEAKLYFSTSLSETMGLGMVEQWAAGIPSVTHPKVYLHGINYQTGIITNRDVESYCKAIIEIMENDILYRHLSSGAQKFAKINFSSQIIINNYLKVVKDVLIDD